MKGTRLKGKLRHLTLTDIRTELVPAADIKTIGEECEFRKAGKRFSEI